MDYDIKANITTILTFFLMPVFASLGVDAVTGNALVGALAVIVFYVLMYLNERYLSGIFTKDGYSVIKNTGVCECACEEDAVNPEYYEDPIKESDDVDEGA